jgi:hypothetical protein
VFGTAMCVRDSCVCSGQLCVFGTAVCVRDSCVCSGQLCVFGTAVCLSNKWCLFFYSLEQRFSNFFQVGTIFSSQNVLGSTLLLSALKANLSFFLNDKFV